MIYTKWGDHCKIEECKGFYLIDNKMPMRKIVLNSKESMHKADQFSHIQFFFSH